MVAFPSFRIEACTQVRTIRQQRDPQALRYIPRTLAWIDQRALRSGIPAIVRVAFMRQSLVEPETISNVMSSLPVANPFTEGQTGHLFP